MPFIFPFNVYILVISILATTIALQDAFSTRDFITAKKFQENILNSSEVFLVFFFKSAEDVRDELLYNLSDKLLNYGIKIAYIDCSNKLNKAICPMMNVPSLQMYMDKPELNPYTAKYYRQPIPFTGHSPKNEDIERFVNRKYPNEVVKAKSLEDLNIILTSSSSSGSNNINTNMTTVLLFSEKDTIPMLFKSIAYKFKHQIKFIQIYSKTATDIISYYHIQKLPTMLVLTQSNTTNTNTNTNETATSAEESSPNFIEYSSSLTDRDEMISWLQSFILLDSPMSGSDSSTGTSGSSGKWITADESLQIDSLDSSSAYIFGVFPTTTSSSSGSATTTATDDTASVSSTTNSASNSIVDGNLEYELWKNISALCEGNVKAVLVKCSSSSSSSSTFGESLCSYNNKSNNSSNTNNTNHPYIYILKYSSSASITTSNSHTSNSRSKIDPKHIFQFSSTSIIDAKEIVYDSLPHSNVKQLMSEQSFHQFVQENHQTQVLSIVILSKKQTVSALIHNIALSISKIHSIENPHQPIAKVGFLSDLSPDFLRNLGNPKVPGMVAMSLMPPPEGDAEAAKQGLQARVINYDPAMYGPIRHETALQFTRGVYAGAGLGTAMPESAATSVTGIDSASLHSSKGGVQLVSEISTAQDWSTHCSESFKGICAIALFGSNNNDNNDSNHYKQSFHIAAKKIMSSSSSSSTTSSSSSPAAAATFRFMSIDNTDICHASFMDSFGLNSLSLPAVVAYSSSKRRYAVFKGTFSESEIKSFYDSVLSGGQSTVSTPTRPVFIEACDASNMASSTSARSGQVEIIEEMEDASDLLEEIRREEAEAIKQRKLEMDEEIKQRLLLEQQQQQDDDKKKKKTVKKVVKKKNKKSSKSAKTEL